MKKQNLAQLRKEIDSLDREFISVLSKRMKTVNIIGQYKKEYGLKPLDKKRWRAVLKSRIAFAKSLGLPSTLINELFDLIHKYSLSIQKEVKNYE